MPALLDPECPHRKRAGDAAVHRRLHARLATARDVAFFTESFIDELARAAGMEPLAFRMSMLGQRSAARACLQGAARLAQWDGGGAGSTMGIAGCSAFGSHIALVASASIGDDQRVKVHRLVAAVDCGRVVNPGIVQQQIEGGTDLGARAGNDPSAGMGGRNAPCPAYRRYWSSAHGRASADRGGDHPEQRSAGWRQRAWHDCRSLRPSPTPSLRGPANGCVRCHSISWRSHDCRPIIRRLPDPKVGVLLINLGTPDAPHARAVRRYLAEFLSDPRVVEIPAIAWKPILHGIILRTRPRRSAEAYNQVWTNEGSPLRGDRAAAGASAARAACGPRQRPLCDALRQPGHRRGDRATWSRKAARASSPRRSIRNIAQQRRRPRTMRCSRALAAMRVPAGVAHAAALLRRSALHRCARDESDTATRRAGFRARAPAAQLPRDAAADAGARRPLSLPLPENGAASVAKRWDARSTSRSSRASAERNGWSRRQTRLSPAIRKAASSA